MIPNSRIELPADKVETFLKMIDALEDNDDVQAIWHNWDMPEEDDED